MSLLSNAKTALRITSTAYDGEVEDLIAAAQDDLKRVGVTDEAIYNEVPLVKRAIMAYVKGNFGFGNPDRDGLVRAYEMIRDALSMSSDYGYYAVTFTVTGTLGALLREAVVTFNGETMPTDADGTVTFRVKPGSNYAYTVSADGYATDDDAANLIDVTTESVPVAVSLVVV